MLIGSIRQTSPGRLTVCLEDGTEIKSTLGVVTDMRLFNGRELDEETVGLLRKNSERALLREKALEYVSRRQMSHKELKDKLLQKGADEDAADYAVQWLSENGFINEEYYAGAIARHYTAKGYGQGRIRAELRRRGLGKELSEDAINELPEDTTKIDKFISSRLTDPDDRQQVQKISAALYRRGFSWDEIRSAMRRFSAGDGEYE